MAKGITLSDGYASTITFGTQVGYAKPPPIEPMVGDPERPSDILGEDGTLQGEIKPLGNPIGLTDSSWEQESKCGLVWRVGGWVGHVKYSDRFDEMGQGVFDGINLYLSLPDYDRFCEQPDEESKVAYLRSIKFTMGVG